MDKSLAGKRSGKQLVLVEYEKSLQRLGGDKELFSEFVDIFMADSPKMIDDICSAIETADALALEKSAHALKGLMSNFGAKPCCDMALSLEIAGREQMLSEVDDQLPRLRELYAELCSELASISG